MPAKHLVFSHIEKSKVSKIHVYETLVWNAGYLHNWKSIQMIPFNKKKLHEISHDVHKIKCFTLPVN